MLPKLHRLPRGRLFPKTMAAGDCLYKDHWITVLGLKRVTDEPTATKFGFIVSKKVSNRAHDRNRIKRWLRELLRRDVLVSAPPEVYAPYIAVVLIARPASQNATFNNLKQSIAQWTKRSHE